MNVKEWLAVFLTDGKRTGKEVVKFCLRNCKGYDTAFNDAAVIFAGYMAGEITAEELKQILNAECV